MEVNCNVKCSKLRSF